MEWIYFFLAILAGSLIPIQTSANTQLSKIVGGLYPATLIVFAVALILILAVLLITRSTMPNYSQIQTVPLYGWLGGVIAVIYILALTFLAPKLGIGIVTVLVVSGQCISITIIEHFGLFGFAVKPINILRIVGVISLVLGVYLIRKH
jgi:transporter family-2 protein